MFWLPMVASSKAAVSGKIGLGPSLDLPYNEQLTNRIFMKFSSREVTHDPLIFQTGQYCPRIDLASAFGSFID